MAVNVLTVLQSSSIVALYTNFIVHKALQASLIVSFFLAYYVKAKKISRTFFSI